MPCIPGEVYLANSLDRHIRTALVAVMANKYLAKATWLDGIRFASGAEARRYGQLKLLKRAGKIGDIELQPKFEITISGIKVGTYIADFAYVDLDQDRRVVEDVKSPATKTALYKFKRRCVEAMYGITITEIGAG